MCFAFAHSPVLSPSMKLVFPHLDLAAEKDERESRDARAREERREAVPAKAASPNYFARGEPASLAFLFWCKESSRFRERPARGRVTARHFRTICAVPNDAFPRRSFEVCATGRIAKRVSFPKRWNVQDRTCVRRLAPTFPLVFSDYCVCSAEMAA